MCSIGVANQRRRVPRARFLSLTPNKDSNYSLPAYFGKGNQKYYSVQNYDLNLTYVNLSITHHCTLEKGQTYSNKGTTWHGCPYFTMVYNILEYRTATETFEPHILSAALGNGLLQHFCEVSTCD